MNGYIFAANGFQHEVMVDDKKYYPCVFIGTLYAAILNECPDVTIKTITGKTVNLLHPTPDMFCIEDIACGLSRIPRFVGHTVRPYSVAEHSLYVARWIYKNHPELCPYAMMQGLLHDAAEAYLQDMPGPLKSVPVLGQIYKKIEERMDFVIREKLVGKLEDAPDLDFRIHCDRAVKAADRALLEIEKSCIRDCDYHGVDLKDKTVQDMLDIHGHSQMSHVSGFIYNTQMNFSGEYHLLRRQLEPGGYQVYPAQPVKP
jgi:hypothetical protein